MSLVVGNGSNHKMFLLREIHEKIHVLVAFFASDPVGVVFFSVTFSGVKSQTPCEKVIGP